MLGGGLIVIYLLHTSIDLHHTSIPGCEHTSPSFILGCVAVLQTPTSMPGCATHLPSTPDCVTQGTHARAQDVWLTPPSFQVVLHTSPLYYPPSCQAVRHSYTPPPPLYTPPPPPYTPPRSTTSIVYTHLPAHVPHLYAHLSHPSTYLPSL